MIRVIDIFLSISAIIFLMPVFLIIIILLRFSGEGEIFFLQKRVGQRGIFFSVIKFATMLKDSTNIGTGTITLDKDPRILPMGHFLRKSKINELPQLLNILKGDMSFIGQRPQAERCYNAFSEDFKKIYFKYKPGLSSLASIYYIDEENILASQKNPLDYYDNTIAPHKEILDSWFLENLNFVLYIKTFIATILCVLGLNKITAMKIIGYENEKII
jgi:lipopolysaccharide/colanic/teichoic acid biosynthesis glycosyltransferase